MIFKKSVSLRGQLEDFFFYRDGGSKDMFARVREREREASDIYSWHVCSWLYMALNLNKEHDHLQIFQTSRALRTLSLIMIWYQKINPAWMLLASTIFAIDKDFCPLRFLKSFWGVK